MTIEDLEKLNPCKKGLLYAKQFFSLQDAWNNCTNPHWMWWLLIKTNKVSPELSITYSDASVTEYDSSIKQRANILRSLVPNPFN